MTDTETSLAMVEQARAAGCHLVRRTEGIFVRIGAKAALVEVASLDALEDLLAADACGLSGAPRCTNRYSDT